LGKKDRIKKGFLGSNEPLDIWEKVMVYGITIACIKLTMYGYIFLN